MWRLVAVLDKDVVRSGRIHVWIDTLQRMTRSFNKISFTQRQRVLSPIQNCVHGSISSAQITQTCWHTFAITSHLDPYRHNQIWANAERSRNTSRHANAAGVSTKQSGRRRGVSVANHHLPSTDRFGSSAQRGTFSPLWKARCSASPANIASNALCPVP